MSLCSMCRKRHFGLATSSLFKSLNDINDPQPKLGLPFIVASLTMSCEIHGTDKIFIFSKYIIKHFKDVTMLAQVSFSAKDEG